MEIITPIVVIALLGAVAWFVAGPLRRGAGARAAVELEGRRADLEAARDAKYREIRELELDHRTGKLSDPDWRQLDRELRAEAVDLLHELDRLGGVDGAGDAAPEPPSEGPRAAGGAGDAAPEPPSEGPRAASTAPAMPRPSRRPKARGRRAAGRGPARDGEPPAGGRRYHRDR